MKNGSLPILSVKTEKRRIGTFGEQLAARYLLFHGYRILAKNYVAHGHEIDLIAKKNNTVHLIEVKTRNADKHNPSEPRPASAVTKDKQKSIISAARYFILSNKRSLTEGTRYSFDIMEITYRKKTVFGFSFLKKADVKHLIGCFDRTSVIK